MSEVAPGQEQSTAGASVGERLRAAREARGWSLDDVASRTRIPLRHLKAIETSDFAGLPSPTYAVGFARSYARAVGLDEVAVAREVRQQQDLIDRPEYVPYEMPDPARVPPRWIAVAGVLIALIVLVIVFLWFGTTMFREQTAQPAQPTPVAASAGAPGPVATATPAPAAGQVTLTALKPVWVRVYDAANTTLLMKTMQPGERFDVPATADNPQINLGRPDDLQVAVNGRVLAPLGPGDRAIKDVGISAAALANRPTATDPAPVPSPSATPSPTPSASPSHTEHHARHADTTAAANRAEANRTQAAPVPPAPEPSASASPTP